MSSTIREWLNLGVRWIHVFAGIMWVGQTYYFTWLDGQFGKLEKKVAANGKASAVWMVHSGGVFFVGEKKNLGGGPGGGGGVFWGGVGYLGGGGGVFLFFFFFGGGGVGSGAFG